MRMSALMNSSPAGGVRPSTVIGPHANIWLSGSDDTRPDAVTPGSALRAAPTAAGRRSSTAFASLYVRPVIVSSSVRTLAGIEARRHVLQAREAADQQTGADQQHDRQRELGDRRADGADCRRRPRRCCAPAEPRPASLRFACRSTRDSRNAGASPNKQPDTERDAQGEEQHSPLIAISSRRGTLAAPSARIHSRLPYGERRSRRRAAHHREQHALDQQLAR